MNREEGPSDIETRYSFQILSKGKKESWVRHASGGIVIGSQNLSKENESIELIKQRCTEELKVSEVYSYFDEVGIEYGPMFQGIRKLYCGEREILAQVELDTAIRDTDILFTLHFWTLAFKPLS